MSKLKLGVIAPSEVAFRRFLPALMQNSNFEFAGISVASQEEWCETGSAETYVKIKDNERQKAQSFIDAYGGKLFDSYQALIFSDIDALYVPLPPSLHFRWGKLALDCGKHILLEKPFTTSSADTEALVAAAKVSNLAVHENYAFLYHPQLSTIRRLLDSGVIGELRLIRTTFSFPLRSANDFRYNKQLGGGALLDAGGYVIRLACELLGDSAYVADSQIGYTDGFDVDMFGNLTLKNADGVTVQAAYGMDNGYQCKLELFGSKGKMYANRIFTAPPDFTPEIIIETSDGINTVNVPAANQFALSIDRFYQLITDLKLREAAQNSISLQSKLVERIKEQL